MTSVANEGIAEVDGQHSIAEATLVIRSGRFCLVRFETSCSLLWNNQSFKLEDIDQMSTPTPNPRGAAFWNSTMGHAWVSQHAVISDVFTSVTTVSLGLAAAKQGEHVIDIGCGTGDTLLAFARAVGPSGAALGVDVSVPMLEFARHRAAEARLANATCALADAMTYAFEPRRANLVYSRFGVMFFDDPVKAFTNSALRLLQVAQNC